MTFQKATKRRAKLRLALIGPSGSGKTFTALTFAAGLGSRVAVIDTERGSASKYADMFSFDVLEPDSFSPMTYVEAIREAERARYDVLVIDSLSHAWTGKDGALEQVDSIAKRSQISNTFAAWRDVTPQHNAMVDAIIGANMHIIATMRAKTEYIMETNERGKSVPRKVGLAPVQRDGLEYEFDVVADMDLDNNLIVAKSRCPALTGQIVAKPNGNLAAVLKAWLEDGAEPVTLKTSVTNGGEFGHAPNDDEILSQAFADITAAALRTYQTNDPEKLARNAVGSLSKLFGNDDDRHAFTKWAFNVESTNALTEGQRHAVIGFVKLANVGGEWVPCDRAIAVAGAFKRKVLAAAPELAE